MDGDRKHIFMWALAENSVTNDSLTKHANKCKKKQSDLIFLFAFNPNTCDRDSFFLSNLTNQKQMEIFLQFRKISFN